MARIDIKQVRPSKIILAGLNYREHAAELEMPVPDEPVIFIKPVSALIYNDEAIIYPEYASRVDYEAELAVVIGRRARNITQQQVSAHIMGYTCLNDVTERDIQKKDGQWTRAKSFDTFCPVGPWVETEIDDPDNLRIRLMVNGQLRQESSTSDFIFPVFYLVSFISRVMTLEPGDIVSTGTPPGVGPMYPGDAVEIDIEGIGTLKNKVVKECNL